MKKIILGALLLTTAPLISTTASANSGMYVSGGVGSSFIKAKDQNRTWFADQESPEVNINFGSSSKAVFSGDVAVGYDFNNNFNIPVRTELAFTARGSMDKNTSGRDISFGANQSYKGAMQDTKVRMNTLMVNGYYDFHNSTAFTPYVMAGIGVAFNKLEETMVSSEEGRSDETLSKSKANFAWSVGTGVNYAITDNLSADFGVRYIGAGKVTATSDQNDQSTSAKLSSIDMLAGVRYNF